jgi:hypothetical protein
MGLSRLPPPSTLLHLLIEEYQMKKALLPCSLSPPLPPPAPLRLIKPTSRRPPSITAAAPLEMGRGPCRRSRRSFRRTDRCCFQQR